MPKTAMLRKTCNIDWHCTSPPGVPSGIKGLPSLKTMAGQGVRRGRFPGAMALAWPCTAQDCEPRVDTTTPIPGTTGAFMQPSLGVAEKMLPWRSTAQMEIVAFQHRHRLRQHWPLAPRAAGIDVILLEARPHRCLDLHPERR